MIRCGIIFHVILSVLLLIFITSFVVANEQVQADPDYIGSSFEYNGVIKAKAGEKFTCGYVTFGGFIEARNDALFNQGALPNHNWRGYVALDATVPIVQQLQYQLQYSVRTQHESAHATMGIVETPEEFYDRIYDHTYRKYALNSLANDMGFSMFDERNRLHVKLGVQVYGFSKNTPELSGLQSAFGSGLHCGGTYQYTIASFSALFLSVYERYLFQSGERDSGVIWDANGSRMRSYPVFNHASTFTLSGGAIVPLYQARKSIIIFVRYYYGHGYGYIDSRKKSNYISFGLMLGDKFK